LDQPQKGYLTVNSFSSFSVESTGEEKALALAFARMAASVGFHSEGRGANSLQILASSVPLRQTRQWKWKMR
jgi:hypothetical protein